MRRAYPLLLTAVVLCIGCAHTPTDLGHTVGYQLPIGEYDIQIRSAIVRQDTNADSPEVSRWISVAGLAIHKNPQGALTRSKSWIRVDGIYNAGGMPLHWRLDEAEFRPSDLGHMSSYSAEARGASHILAIGNRRGFDERILNMDYLVGTVVVFEAKTVGARLLDLEDSVADAALLRVVPGVYVGITDVAQENGEFSAVLRYWVSKPLTNSRGNTRFDDPVVPLSYSISRHGNLDNSVGSARRGWKAPEVSVPALLEFEFLTQQGEVIFTLPENAVVVCELETATLGEIEVRFPLGAGEAITHFNPVVITEERLVEIPFKVHIDALENFSIVTDEDKVKL